jgi:sugar phosphate isomerase/epimerase
MAESLHDFMKVGIIHFMAYPQCGGGEGPVVETFKSLALDPFFDVIEVTQMKDPVVRKQVRALAEQSRVDIPFGAQPILLGGKLDLNSPDAAARQKAIDAIKGAIDQAAELDSEALAVLSGPVTDDCDEAMGRLTDSLKQLCAYGKTKGIRIVLETFDQVPYGKNCLIGPTEHAVKVSEAVRQDYPDFGILLDLSHLPLQAETAKHAIKTAGKHLVHVHIGNCAMDDPKHPAYGDNHPRFGAPGTRNDVPELVQFLMVLLDNGYLRRDERRTVSFEVKPMAGEDPEAVVAGSKRTLVEAWRRLEQEGHLAAILAAAIAS